MQRRSDEAPFPPKVPRVPVPVVPVLAVTRLGGQTFVYVATGQDGKFVAKQRPITVGDTVGNDYAVRANYDHITVAPAPLEVDRTDSTNTDENGNPARLLS